MTALDLIKGSLRLIGAISTGETPEAAEANDCLVMLNQLLETLSLSGLTVWNQSTQSFPLVINQASYTIGTAQNFATTKPIKIRDAYVTDNGISYNVTQIDQRTYDSIGYKAQTAPYPIQFLYVDGNQTGNIIFWPVPSKVTTLTLNIDTQYTQIATLSDVILWPAGYARMIRYLLALDLADDFDRDVPQTLLMKAMDAKASVMRTIKRNNTPMSYPATLTGRGSFNQLLTGISGGY